MKVYCECTDSVLFTNALSLINSLKCVPEAFFFFNGEGFHFYAVTNNSVLVLVIYEEIIEELQKGFHLCGCSVQNSRESNSICYEINELQ